jgi:hypothetical protein
MAQPKLKKQKGKLKPHIRSHVSGSRFNLSKHQPHADHLHRQAKRLERELKNERRPAPEV